MSNIRIEKIYDRSWAIVEEDRVTSYLFEGDEMALLIDSGWEISNMREVVEELTDKPVLLALSHADVDHISCNDQFKEIWMHPADYSFYHDLKKGRGKINALWDGDIIDLGGREFLVVHMPGHTMGSIAFLDMDNKVLAGGDGIQDGDLYMYGEQRSLLAHMHSLERLMDEFEDLIEKIYPSHSTFPIGPEIIPQLIDGIEKVLNDEIEGEVCWEGDDVVRSYDIGVAKILYEAKDRRKYLTQE